jgi:PTS system nitrogen regulatory IIA component
MHFGATLRLLRVDAGVSLRALAQQVGVSSAYLSRVENGHDQAPTTDRLLEIARALDLPPTLLIELAQRVTPFVTQYLADVPSASHLFLEIARRQLGPAQLARLHAVMDHEFPAHRSTRAGPPAPRICELLRPERVIVRLSCAHLGDAIDVAATRLAGADHSASDLAWEIHRREREAPTAIGHGVAIPHVGGTDNGAPSAALVTLARPIAGDTPDGAPLQLVLVLVGAPLALLARAVRLATPETVASLTAAGDPEAVLARLRHAEAAFA